MVFSAHLNFMEFILFTCIQFRRQTETVLFFIYSWIHSLYILSCIPCLFKCTTPPSLIKIQNIFKISLCVCFVRVTVISLSHINLLISFHMALVPACILISHTLAPHSAVLLNMLFLDKLVPLLCLSPFISFLPPIQLLFHDLIFHCLRG